ncbi:MAG: hypothetical protein KDA91_24145 [Planctomycetaceae bacterium]|nr:hypothetical protein [Planctomycetaceae bacterium]
MNHAFVRTFACACLLGLLNKVGVCSDRPQQPAPPAGMKLVYEHDFEDGKSDRYSPTDRTAWTLKKSDSGDSIMSLHKKNSDFKPRHRSPFNRTLINDLKVRSFVMDIQMKSTIPDYNHRSLCLFFGYRDDSHLYYVHFGKKTDDHANQIFIVNDAPRTKISTKTTPGTNWDDNWHNGRVVRNVDDGTIQIYFDNMDVPIMTATDKTFTEGQVGFGSFDDIGDFDNVRVYVPEN